MYFNIYSIPVVIAGLIMLLIAIVIRKYRKIPGVNCFTMLMMAGVVYSLFYTLEISTSQLELVTVFYKLEYLGIPLIPAFYLLFAIRYSGLKERSGILLTALIFLMPAITIFMVFTNSYHHLFISESAIDFQAWFPSHVFKAGLFYWLHQVYAIIAFIISFVLFLKLYIVSAPVFRKQVGIILLASVVPFLIYVFYLTGAFPYGLDPIPFAFAIAGLIVYAGLHFFRLFDLTPLARNLLFEKIPNSVVIFDEHSRLVDFNQAAAILFQLSAKMIGKARIDVFAQHPVVLNLLAKPVSDEVEILQLEINHATIYLSCSRSIIADEKNTERGTMLIMQDISLQHTLEIRRRETEEKFRLIFENTPLGMLYYDNMGVIRLCNDNFVSIIGSGRDRLIGLNMLQLPDKRVVSALQNALDGKKGFYEGVYHSVTANKVTHLRMLLEVIRNPQGKVVGGLGIVEDITERVENEERIKQHNLELQRLNAEKDRFFSIIAHDLRSPFNSFLGYTELMTEETDHFSKDELKSFAQEIRKSAVVLFGLLENLLEWARLQQQAIVMDQKPLKLQQIIAQSIQVFENAARGKEIEIVNLVSGSVIVFADEKMLSSVFRNLISNAVKFTKRGGKVEISANYTGNGMAEVKVSDTGVGIHEKNMERLFRIDQKSSTPGTENEPSTGLGLILCREFIEKLGGKIWVVSKPGLGSDFYFSIPVKDELFD